MDNKQGQISQVQEQLEALEKVSHVMAALLEELESRLNEVLVTQAPTDKATEPDKLQLVPMADSMRDHVQFLTLQSNRLRNIISSIEL